MEVTNNRRLHTRYYTIEATTDRHEELLSELLVTDSSVYCLSLLNTVSAKDVLEFSSSGSLSLSSQNALDEQWTIENDQALILLCLAVASSMCLCTFGLHCAVYI